MLQSGEHRFRLDDEQWTDMQEAFALYGYDAGVLGGVQNTQPFLDAIGVRKIHSQRHPKLINHVEPHQLICCSHGRFIVCLSSNSDIAGSYFRRYAARPKRLYPHRRRLRRCWLGDSSLSMVFAAHHRRQSLMWFRHWFHFQHRTDLHGRDEYRVEGTRPRGSSPVCLAHLRYCRGVLDRLWVYANGQSNLLEVSHRVWFS
jgi:hypothetical protein